ncbi:MULTISPECIES: 50S ribosomal protein L25/general stress protein Ctc [Psychrobacillus]|uniref:Large ribosomal subunit protein bL25 n=1 Tax=Psychrobacillus faecigallinarum TaxID=2762235 RepID=A0ABR8REQ5_9BACI|nr:MULTISPECIES: 50S ribosomal protein L25/general stress protein Ctc [Psychrobacillus]MBD7946263.1 50S ribosomal protein L25/general stress protein Ctc [Psychrobacillus faecigallinarum]QEY21341.1 50S ribosomal protein L25/general stress protein Ctc [Psychrobacillus sp. AK 1817]
MATIIKAQKRSQKENSKLRNSGYIPAVVYGFKVDSQPIAVDEKDLTKTLREVGRNGVMKLDVEGSSVNVVLNDYQMNILKGQMIHADFLAINMKEELEVSVTVNTTGTSIGVSEGGLLQQPNREVTVLVKPSDIPDSIEVDVTETAIGDTITVGDVREKVNYTIVEDDDFTLVTVSAPRVETEPETETEAEDTEEAPSEE